MNSPACRLENGKHGIIRERRFRVDQDGLVLQTDVKRLDSCLLLAGRITTVNRLAPNSPFTSFKASSRAPEQPPQPIWTWNLYWLGDIVPGLDDKPEKGKCKCSFLEFAAGLTPVVLGPIYKKERRGSFYKLSVRYLCYTSILPNQVTPVSDGNFFSFILISMNQRSRLRNLQRIES